MIATKPTTEELKSLGAELDILSNLTKKELTFAKKHGMTFVGTCGIIDWTVIDYPIRVSLLKLPGVEGEYIGKTAYRDHNTKQYVSRFRNVGWISRDYGTALKYHWRNIDWRWEFQRYQTHNYWNSLQSLVKSSYWKERIPEVKTGNLTFNNILKSDYEYSVNGKKSIPFGNEHQFLFARSMNDSLPYAEYTFKYLLIFDSTESYRDTDSWKSNMTSRRLGVNIDYEKIEDVVKERFFGISRSEEKFSRDLMFIGAKDKQVFLGLSTDVGLESLIRVFKGFRFKVDYYERPKKD